MFINSITFIFFRTLKDILRSCKNLSIAFISHTHAPFSLKIPFTSLFLPLTFERERERLSLLIERQREFPLTVPLIFLLFRETTPKRVTRNYVSEYSSDKRDGLESKEYPSYMYILEFISRFYPTDGVSNTPDKCYYVHFTKGVTDSVLFVN